MSVVHTLRHFIQSALLSIRTAETTLSLVALKQNQIIACIMYVVGVLVREQLRDLTKQYDKSENDLKALQSVGQVSRCYYLKMCNAIFSM